MKRITLQALAFVLAGAVLALPFVSAAVPQAGTGAAAKKTEEPIDINSAAKDKLMTIKGIGDAYAAAIIKNRPYKRKDELVAKKVLPQGVYDKVKDQIVAKQK